MYVPVFPALPGDRVGRGRTFRALQSIVNGMPRPAEIPPQWVSYHVFHHDAGDQVLLRLALPAVRDLWRRRRIVRFFFVRYGLGGPHVRLRLLCAPKHRGEIDEVVQGHAAELFARWPSDRRLSDEEIRGRNQHYLAGDTAGGIDAVYPDNSMIELPFHPEVERYGGPELLDHSLCFFCVSSVYVLRQAELRVGEPRSRLLARGLRALLRQALGFAATGEEVSRLVAYAGNGLGPAPLLERADQEFERGREAYGRLLREEVENALDPAARTRITDSLLTEAARLLRRQIRSAPDAVRWRIVSSQCHMTANRMGLLSPEELYVGRILWRTLQHVANADPALWSSLESSVREPGRRRPGGMSALAAASLQQLVPSTGWKDSWIDGA
jgi:hypothetical protein